MVKNGVRVWVVLMTLREEDGLPMPSILSERPIW